MDFEDLPIEEQLFLERLAIVMEGCGVSEEEALRLMEGENE